MPLVFSILPDEIFLVALKEIIKREDLKNFCLIIYGTPAEETGNGKIKMIQHGVFDEADICMMSHPFLLEIPEPEGSALVEMKFRFEGKIVFLGIYFFHDTFFFYYLTVFLPTKFARNCSIEI